MKANELMIGDWIKPSCWNEQVILVGEGRVTVNSDSYPEDEIKPIPLTAEILEKNGFDVSDGEVMRYNFEEDGQSFHFSLRQMYDKENKPKGYSFYAFNVLTIIDFVHELQHALKLCGIEKEIEL